MTKEIHENGVDFIESVTTNNEGKIIHKMKLQNMGSSTDELVVTMSIGTDYQPICVPGGSTITVLSKTFQIAGKGLYKIEVAAHNNLPSCIVLHQTYIAPKAWQASIILINTTKSNMECMDTTIIDNH